MKRSRFLVLIPLTVVAQSALAAEAPRLAPVEVEAPAVSADSDGTLESTFGATDVDPAQLSRRAPTTSDGAKLLEGTPGVHLAGAGGISSLPVVRGLADDRVHVRVDGVELTSACPNHMNSPLSYVSPTATGGVRVYPSIAPVSVGSDSLGSVVIVEGKPLAFAEGRQRYLVHGDFGSHYKTNGNAFGVDLTSAVAGRWWSIRFHESASSSDNVRAGGDFKLSAPTSSLPADTIGSSAYRFAINRQLTVALRGATRRIEAEVKVQTVGFEGFPNQRMDLTNNDNMVVGLRYVEQRTWGEVKAAVSYQWTEHAMDMGGDRFSYGAGMPMRSRAATTSATFSTNWIASERDIVRLGADFQRNVLYDWWPPTFGVMGPRAFWNIDFGRRTKASAFVEWEAILGEALSLQLGARSSVVRTEASPVQGYDNSLSALWGADAAAFNANSRAKTDFNVDVVGSARATPKPWLELEVGLGRKTRSPNLYQRYAWATNPMAALMNNFVGDGNGYLGNVDLRPESAYTLGVAGRVFDAKQRRWNLRLSAYVSYIQDFIDARRCDFGQCSSDNTIAQKSFVILQYENSDAELFGAELDGRLQLHKSAALGAFFAGASAALSRGRILSTNDNMYLLMPPNLKLALTHQRGVWGSAFEAVGVADKNSISSVRNEIPTDGYWLVNLRSGAQWSNVRVELRVDNLFDVLYANPMGGAYVGQGSSMTTQGLPWGVAVPGHGRTVATSLRIEY